MVPLDDLNEVAQRQNIFLGKNRHRRKINSDTVNIFLVGALLLVAL